MPRKKRKKEDPIERYSSEDEWGEIDIQVWKDPADEGTRGVHMRSLRSKVYDAVLEDVESYLTGKSETQREIFSRLIDGRASKAEFGRTIIKIAKVRKFTIKKTLSEDIAEDIRNHYKNITSAIAKDWLRKKTNRKP